ncbi:MAG TPA: hypothetical protein VN704_03420, partial [Verrucomicrobiae bacterium]|nr:hypothetical protein [Verrucomicrobiae bacterium]
MSITFEIFVQELIKAIDESNTYLIDKITNPDSKYELSCIKPNLTTNKYFRILKKKWDERIKKLMSQLDECDSFAKLMFLYKTASNSSNLASGIDLQKLEELTKKQNLSAEGLKNTLKNFSISGNENMQNLVLEALVDNLMQRSDDYGLDENAVVSLHRLIKVVSSRSLCWLWDIISVLAMAKYKRVLKNKSKEEIIQLVRQDINYVIGKAREMNLDTVQLSFKSIIDNIINKIMGMHFPQSGMSIE